MTKSWHFKGILIDNGWLENAYVQVDDLGNIVKIDQTPGEEIAERINGYALPGFQNAHSHAFQYAMVGITELHSINSRHDDFWSWRSNMYNLALKISPEDLEGIATMLYAEMVRHGYTSVAEFHYLHHDKNGKPYDHLAEMGERLIAAAQTSGIKITLIPIFYQRGGFGKQANTEQRRFLSKNLDAYDQLLIASDKVVKQYHNARLGQGVHSLRAVDLIIMEEIGRLLRNDRPFHIHISEQLKEIEECVTFTNQRPVEWLLNHMSLNENYHLVHATHLNDFEVKGIAGSGANVVLCPSTEGNLGDGLFRLRDFTSQGGHWCIGTDSQVGLSPFEEFRLLDYAQRIHSHQRNIFTNKESGDSGRNALNMAWKSGTRAMGSTQTQHFQKGHAFDAVVVDANAPLIACTDTKHLCNTLVYSSDVSNVLGTMINGEWIVKNHQHRQVELVQNRFIKTIQKLGLR